MGKTMLQKLFFGEVYPFEQICPAQPGFKQDNIELETCLERVKEMLGEKEAKRIEMLETNISIAEMETAFAYGLRMGLCLGNDLFAGA